MFVPIAALGLLGITLTELLRFVEKRVAPWMHQAGASDETEEVENERRISIY